MSKKAKEVVEEPVYAVGDKVVVKPDRNESIPMMFPNAPKGKYASAASNTERGDIVRYLFGKVTAVRSIDNKMSDGTTKKLFLYTLEHWPSDDEPKDRQTWNERAVDGEWFERHLLPQDALSVI